MKHRFPSTLLALALVLSALAATCACSRNSGESRTPFRPDNYGIPLHGGYRFYCGDGELSSLVSPDGHEIVPPGAVLSVVRAGYCIGRHDGGAFYHRDGQRIDLDRVFFVVHPDGKLEFAEPHPDSPGFPGPRIVEKITFRPHPEGTP